MRKAVLTIDTGAAQTRFQKAFMALLQDAKKSAKVLFKAQAKGVARNVFAVTPPFGGSGASVIRVQPGQKPRGIRIDWASGKKAGKAKIESHVARATESVSVRAYKKRKLDPVTFRQVLTWYRSIQNKRKVPTAAHKPLPAPIVKELKNHLLSKQGWTPSGWMRSAKALGVSGIPGWITRHSGNEGRYRFVTSPTYFYFETVNKTNHPNSGYIQSLLNIAVIMQARAMERWLKNYLEKKKVG